MIFGLRHRKEREREHEERLERVRSSSHRRGQTTTPSPDAPLSSRWWDLAARSCHRAHAARSRRQDCAREIVLSRSHPSRSHREIVPPPSRSNSFRLNLDTAWSLPPLDRSRHPWPTHDQSLSFSIYLSLSPDLQSLSLPPPSLSLTKRFCVLRMVLFWFLFL